MDSLLPSEIARLVLGYLEDQKCDTAARSFLEMSPHLHECRMLTEAGRRFSTKVNGFTLTDVLDKYCAANATIQERLSKVSDCEQLKHCGDLSEQLRFLVDGSRGQRFVVNINVPTASQTSGGSPIISSSVRKRHHSGSERDRSKRAHKSHSQSWGKTSEQAASRLGCDAVETTPLEHLPGHSSSDKSDNIPERNFEKSPKERPMDCCSSTVPEAVGSKSLPENHQSTSLSEDQGPCNLGASNDKISLERHDNCHEKCSTATDTEELMRFTNTEVQTTPYDVAESETELTDEPVENLSLLTKELLNRTELQERIADNINKAILPADISLRDASLTEALGGEINTSIMTELNNAIKSVVPAIESDPVFAKFLDEIIGPNGENDTSPDEDAADHQPLNAAFSDISPDLIAKPVAIESSTPHEKKSTPPPVTPEVPLKNRLRSSASQQTVRPEQDRASSQKPIEKEDIALEDLNAAAILSIINANNKLEEEKRNADLVDAAKEIIEFAEAVEVENTPPVVSEIPEATNIAVQLNVPPAAGTTKPSRKANVRKPRAKTKPKVPEVIPENLISEEEIMAMPTLIVCSKEEMSCFIGVPPTAPKAIGGYCASQFLPIAPKTSDMPPPKPEPIYLRTVHVPTKIPKSTESEIPTKPAEVQEAPRSKPKEPRHHSNEIEKSTENISTSVLDLPTENANTKTTEKITLYGNENSNITVLEDALFPSVNLEQPVSVSGTGLSPFLKFNNNKPAIDPGAERKSAQAVEAEMAVIDTQPMEQEAAATASASKPESFEMLTKRTPRSLLKSRSKNHRLSLSTPRRRSSHIRALDFNTPTKGMNCNRRMSINEKSMQFTPNSCNFVKNVCRTSLFKSPPFTGSPTSSAKKIKSSPVKDCRVPIATRSPAPKLMGGWEKYTGVGIILGGASPSSTSCSPVKNVPTTSKNTKKSWDADLRQSLKITEDLPKVTKKAPPKKLQSCKRRGRKKRMSTPSVAEDEASCEIAPKEPDAPAISTTSAELTDEKSQPAEVTKETVNLTRKADELPTKNIAIENLHQSTSEIMSRSTETVEIHTDNSVIVKSSKIVKKKKYAQLKTLTSSVTRVERCESGMELSNNAMERSEKILEFDRHCPESSQRMHLPNMLDLETPRKLENFGIPPTPRLLSPSSSLTTPFALGIGEDSVKVMRSFIPTPEFPPTPSIAITPKQLSENTVESGKKDDFACSNYYQPSSELKDPRVPKLQNDQSGHDMSLPLPGIITTSKEMRANNISAQVAQGFQASTTSGKLEITQFEVIKENLPREEAFKELKIESATTEIVSETATAVIIDPSTDAVETTKELDKSGSTIDDDSSDSDSSCSSDSSSSSSSSSSCSSSATNTSANVTLTKQYTKRTPNKIYTDTSNDSIQKSAANVLGGVIAKSLPAKNSLADQVNFSNNLKTMMVSSSSSSSRLENEASPKKVFPIVKTQEAIDECPAETPVKDDTLLTEANISETPSSSKTGFDNVTNLTSKISAFITTEESKRSRTTEITEKTVAQPPRKALPKVISVQRILPDVSIALKPSPGNDLCNAMQNRPNPAQQINTLSNAKLSRQLEEKRLRLMAKFKEKDAAPAYRPRIKRTVAIARSRKRSEMDENNAEDITNGESGEKELPRRQSSRLRDAEQSVENSKNSENDEEEKKNQEAKNVKAERDKKSQMLKELFDESCSTLTPIKTESHGDIKRAVDVVTQANEAEKKCSTDTLIDKEQKEEAPKNDLKSKSRTSQNQESAKPRDKLTGRKSTESKASKQSAKLDENVSDELSDKLHTHCSGEASLQCEEKAKNHKREECTRKEVIATVPVDSKKTSKSKVDLVKRDLFSDEESSDQRTTRSRTRQTCDLSKTESIEGDNFSDKIHENEATTTRKEDLPGVLECLHLVPTIKNDTMEEDLNVLDVSQRHAEFHFIYDDSVPTKRRKRKFSSSELEFSVEVELSDEDYKICSKVMTATVYEEIFNLSPPRKKRGPTKESVKTIKQSKKEITTPNTATTFFSDILDKPLATSSPVVRTSAAKIVASKIVKSPAKKIDAQQTETKKKPTAVKIDKQSENEKHNPKSRKRKASTSKESEQQVDKKPHITTTTTTATTANPQLLLSKLDLDKFLTTVHGPA